MFTLIDTVTLASTNSAATQTISEYRCGSNQLRHIHLHNEDPQLAFMLAVNTPAQSDCGATHALEHMVLSGSQRYPYRDAFFRVERSSAADHLNAVTNESLSTFHFSTRSRADFANLADFMLDSVFAPTLSAQTFASEVIDATREQTAQQPSVYGGVVYNEMRGLARSPAHVLDTLTRAHLYHGSTYSYLSAGHPADITRLTLPLVRDYHALCYQPANSLMLTSGALPASQIHTQLQHRAEHYQNTATRAAPRSFVKISHHDQVAVPTPIGQPGAVVAWHQGDSGNALAMAECLLLLDLCSARADSILCQASCFARMRWPGVLNTVDPQSGQLVLRMGVSKPDTTAHHDTGLNDTKRVDSFLTQILAALDSERLTDRRVNEALARVELQLRLGSVAGWGPDPVHRLHRLANAVLLCPDADHLPALVERIEMSQAAHVTSLLRSKVSTASDARKLIAARLVNNTDCIHLRLLQGKNAPTQQVPSDQQTATARPPRVANSTPTTPASPPPLVAQDLAAPDALIAIHNNADAGPDSLHATTHTQGVVRAGLFLQTSQPDSQWLTHAIRRAHYAIQHGGHTGLAQTHIHLDLTPWSSRERAANSTVNKQHAQHQQAGLCISATGLAHDWQTLLDALRELSQSISLVPDAGFHSFVRSSLRSRQDQLIRFGHRTALSFARHQLHNMSAQHMGSGLGMIATPIRSPESQDTGANAILTLQTLGTLVQGKGVDDGVHERIVFNDATFTSAQHAPCVTDNDNRPGKLPMQQMYEIPGDLNYAASVYDTRPIVLTSADRACLWVLGAAARNTWLLDNVRAAGGAYGVGPDIVDDTLGLFSFRDPNSIATLAHFVKAIDRLSTLTLDTATLEMARVTAHTSLQRQYDGLSTPIDQLWSRYRTFGNDQGYHTLRKDIACVSAEALMQFSQRTLDCQRADGVLASKMALPGLTDAGFRLYRLRQSLND